MTGMKARVNDAVLYEGLDGREAWLFITPDRATVVTDIHGTGGPDNAVVFDKQALQWIIDEMEARRDNPQSS